MAFLTTSVVVIIAYVLAHGLTALIITPVQTVILPDITAFASLLYLPHGVRVLSTWLMGRSAFFALFVGALLSELVFSDLGMIPMPTLLLSIGVGAASALVAFEIFGLLGQKSYASGKPRVHWSQLLLVGSLASVLNSIGQSLVFSGDILPEHSLTILLTYAIGDVVGLVAMTLILMLVFRWVRLRPKQV